MPDKDEFLKTADAVFIRWINGRYNGEELKDHIAHALRTTAEKYERIGYNNGLEDGAKRADSYIGGEYIGADIRRLKRGSE